VTCLAWRDKDQSSLLGPERTANKDNQGRRERKEQEDIGMIKCYSITVFFVFFFFFHCFHRSKYREGKYSTNGVKVKKKNSK